MPLLLRHCIQAYYNESQYLYLSPGTRAHGLRYADLWAQIRGLVNTDSRDRIKNRVFSTKQ
ncbi:hypothetical protein BWP07_06630 [Bacteroides fragilis]|nr:hypothetical protein BWP07_06630 [Bacteroides fragilis]